MANRTSALFVAVLLVALWFAPVLAEPAPAGDLRARVEAATYAIGFPGPDQPQLTLPQWMSLLRVPAISVAVIDDYKIAWAAEYGIADIERGQPLSSHTLFRAGSISKSVNAFGIMRLVQEGRLTLDEDVNRRLKAWKVPENGFTQREKVTLRRILSHTAGLTVQGFPGYAVNEPVPTLLQVLDGQDPANTKPVRVDLVPGTKLRYAGGGTIVSQLLLSETTGEPYERWMQKNVIDRIGMSDSSYENPPGKARAALTATGHRATGQPVEGRWHVYPEMAAAGSWTTPTDLAKFGIEVMRALKGESTLLSRETAEAMLAEQMSLISTSTPAGNGAALGFFVDTKTGRFGHPGADEGFQALLVCFRRGKGVAVMTNSDVGTQAALRLVWNIAREYGWNYDIPKPSVAGALFTLAMRDGASAAIAAARRALQQTDLPLARSPRFALNAAWGLINARRWSDALALLDFQLELLPNADDAYAARAYIYEQTGKREDAVRAAKRALELNPNNDAAKSLLK